MTASIPLIRRLDESEIRSSLREIAVLRIAIFRDFPYLYDGDLDYERSYLEAYASNGDATVLGAFADGRLVGAATASPLIAHHPEFAAPFQQRQMDPSSIYYFGESVLLPAYRGHGAGREFFRLREEAARRSGFHTCLFAAIIRPLDHPRRPEGYVPLEGMWQSLGYRRIEGMTTTFSWKELGETAESPKPMEYWVRELPA